MKKIPAILAITIILTVGGGIFFPTSTSAEVKDRVQEVVSDNEAAIVAKLQTSYEKLVNSALAVIDNTEDYLSKIPVPEGYSCEVDSSVSTLESFLNSQLAEVNSITTLAEFKTLKQETSAYLKSNKDSLTQAITDYVDCAYHAAVDATNAFLQYAKLQSKNMSRSGEDTTALDAAIAEVEALLSQSQSAYNAGNTKEAYALLAETGEYLSEIYQIIT